MKERESVRRDVPTNTKSGTGSKPYLREKKTNYTPYIIGGVILLAILAALIF